MTSYGKIEDMAASIPADVEPAVLRWARESIGLTPVAASRKMKLPDDRVEAWESGTVRPTIAQLRQAARVYKRSLGVFFLTEPPKDFDTLRDFRLLPGSESAEWSPDLHGEYRRAHAQREALLDLAEIDENPPSTAWRLDPLPDSDEDIATAARMHLLSIGPLKLPGTGDKPYEHLNTWASALEEAGVLIMATAGGRVKQAEMRAFSFYFEVLPVIVVNGSDSPRGRLFSLLHEYAHLLLHTGGLCDTLTDTRPTTENRRLEARCNAIAAATLMPRTTVLAQPSVTQHRNASPEVWDYETLRAAAAPYGVSAEAFLRRLVTVGLIPLAYYERRREDFLAAYEEDAQRQRASGGGEWYKTTVRDRGKGFVRAVTDAYERRVIDTYTATTYLDVKAGQIALLAETAKLPEAV